MTERSRLLGEFSLERLRGLSSEKWATFPPEVLPAFIAEMDFEVAGPIRAAILDAVERSDLGYPHPRRLGDAFSSFAARRFGWQVLPATVHPAADVMTGIATVMTATTPHGSGVVVNTPVYPPFLFRTSQSERALVPVPLRGGNLDLESLDDVLARPEVGCYLLCSPHNPLGRVWRRDELTAVADLCRRHEILLLVDEIHAPLVLPGADFVPVLSLDHEIVEEAVAFHSASKGWNIPGLKCGLIVTNSSSVTRAIDDRWEALFPSQLGVVATEAAFSTEAERWLDEVVAQLEENRALLSDLLASELPDLSWTRPEASYLVWLDCTRLPFGEDPAAEFLSRGGVALGHGPDFGPPGAGHVRLNIGTFPELVNESVRRMAASVPSRGVS